MNTDEQRMEYLTGLFEETYIKDIIERNHIEKNSGNKRLD